MFSLLKNPMKCHENEMIHLYELDPMEVQEALHLFQLMHWPM